jgi:hypothetical protein
MRSLISSTGKRGRGRPRTDAVAQHFTMPPELSSRIDTWINGHSDSRPTRPEAIRQLIALGLDAGATPASSLDQRIARQEQKLARKIPAKISPAKGMAVLRKGLAEVEHRRLVAKRKKVATSGQIRAAEPDLESRPKLTTGKKGGNAQNAKPTRRATPTRASRAQPRGRKP